MTTSTRPLKRFSQNFLNNPQIQQKIVQALEIQSDDFVLEIGPGKGALSTYIIDAKPAHFLAVEIDTRWAQHLKDTFGSNIEILQQDILAVDLLEIQKHQQTKLKIIGNLPYNITSPILFHLIDNFQCLHSAVLMTQKEVAKRICASNGNKEYGILSVLTQTYAQAQYLFDVKPGNFFPVPAVDSAVFKLNFFEQITDVDNEQLFRKIVRATFNTRRKMLRNSLGRNFDKSIVYSLNSVDINRRPEELSVNEFKALANEINAKIKQAADEH